MKQLFCSGLFLCLIGHPVWAAQEGTDQSRLVVSIAVKNGKLVAVRDSQKSPLRTTEKFRAQLRISEEMARNILFDDIDKAFGQMPPLYKSALSDREKKLDDMGQLNDDLTNTLRTFTGDWPAFRSKFDAWIPIGTGRFPLSKVFGGPLPSLENLAKISALIFDPGMGPPPPRNFAAGTITFRLADPIGNLDDNRTYQISIGGDTGCQTVLRPKDVVDLLRSFEGKLWRSDDLKPVIEDFYTSRGFQPKVTIGSAKENPKTIKIGESPRIVRIILTDSVATDSIDKLFYYLLPDQQFRVFLEKRPLETLVVEPGQPTLKVVNFHDLGEPHDTANPKPSCTEPYLNNFRLQIQVLQLNQLGFQLEPRPNQALPQCQSIEWPCVEFFVSKPATPDQKTETNPKTSIQPATPMANEQGVIDTNIQKQNKRNSFIPNFPSLVPTDGQESQPPANTATLDSRERKNYVGGGIEYKPGQGVRVFGIFQRSRLGLLSDYDSLSVQAGGEEEVLGGLNYSADFVLFDWLHRRLSLQFTGSSEFEANREFFDRKTDERRTGGLARVELEWFRDLHDTLFRTYLEGRRDTVELTHKGDTVGKQNLTTLELGGLYLGARNEVRYPIQFRLEPQVRFGLGLSDSESSYTLFTLTGNFHRQLPRMLEVDISAHLGVASAHTPIFEQPTLGAADVLRGFRRDAVIGKQLWTVQNEVWMPLPNIGAAEPRLNQFLKRQVRIAGFVDIGGAYETTNAASGLRFSPGLGARLIFFPVIMKLDWAYGIGEDTSRGGHSRFYFSANTNLPF